MKKIAALLFVIGLVLSLASCTHEHSYGVGRVTKEPTCTEDGSRARSCWCGEKITESIPATGHACSDWIVDVPPTCKDEGEQHKECSVCEEILETESIAKLDTHTPASAVIENKVDSKCNETGHYDEVVYCSVCDEELSRVEKEIPKKEHTPSGWIVDTPATCMEEGAQHKECTVCKEVLESEIIEKSTTHTPADAVVENEVDSKCNALGHYDEVVYCSVCKIELSRTNKEIPKKEHTSTGWIVDKYATCKEAGTQHKECSVCKEVLETESIPKLTTHTPADAVIENEVDSKCNALGHYDEVVYCSVCKIEISRTNKEIPKKAHTSTDWIIGKAPTCKEAGTQHKECSVCKQVLAIQSINKLTTHTPVTDPRVEPTYTTTGLTEGSHCSVCGIVIVAQEVIPKLDEKSVLSSKTLTLNGTALVGSITDTVAEFNFGEDITVTNQGSWTLSSDAQGNNTISTKNVTLTDGTNTYYIHLTHRDNTKTTYTVTIQFTRVYSVKFNTGGGTAVETQYVPKGAYATEPSTTRQGYIFLGWSYDFSTPITRNIIATAKWEADPNTPYRVEYYLQNLKNDEYTLVESQSLTGTTATTVSAEKKEYAFFTLDTENSTLRANVLADGSLVLQLYYIRNTYTISNENPEGGELSITGEFKYGAYVSVTATALPGYEFLGWYRGETLISTASSLSIVMEYDIEARFDQNTKPLNLELQFTDTGCILVGIKDKTVKEISIPNYVTEIRPGVLSGCTKLEKLTIPFVGASIGATEASASTLLGYLFGTTGFSGGVLTKQYYSPTEFATYYIPSSLKSVKVTGGELLYGAFYYCSRLTSIELGSGVSAIGERAFYHCTMLGSIVIPEGVRTIGKEAFYDSSNIRSITLPQSITSIGEDAFLSCSALTDVYISDTRAWCNISFASYTANPLSQGASLYVAGEPVEALIIPDGVKSINPYTFYNLSSLTSITIPNSVVTIGEYAFFGCSRLGALELGDSVENIGKNAFSGCSLLKNVTIGKGLKSVGEGAFLSSTKTANVYISDIQAWCNISFASHTSNPIYQGASLYLNGALLTNLVIPEGVENIGDYAFYGCSSIKTVSIPESAVAIGDYAFYRCSGLEVLSIPTGVKVIGENAFAYCSHITSLSFPRSIESIGKNAFQSCSTLSSVYIGDIEAWCNISFESSTANPLSQGADLYIGGKLATDIVIPDSITVISAYAFYEYSALKSVEIGRNVVSIGEDAFSSCSSLTSISIPKNVKTIGRFAFSFCSALLNVVIGDGVSDIGEFAFYSCPLLSRVVMGNSVSSIGENAFAYCTALKDITIPEGTRSIGSFAFADCYLLESVTIDGHLTSIGKDAFLSCTNLKQVHISDIAAWCNISFGSYSSSPLYNGASLYLGDEVVCELAIPYGVTSISPYAFFGCESLVSVVIPASVKEIGDEAFAFCHKLVEVINKSSLDISKGDMGHGEIGYYAEVVHSGSSSVSSQGDFIFISTGGVNYLLGYTGSDTAITLPESYLGEEYEIYGYAFFGYKNLTSVTLTSGVVAIGDGAFYGCENLGSIVIGENVEYIGRFAFAYCASLTNITIPESVVAIDSYAFSYCSSLTKLDLGVGVVSIGRRAFIGCLSLTNITIPESVNEIGEEAFYGCQSLTSVVIGNGVTSIRSDAFSGCKSLATIYYCGTKIQWNSIDIGSSNDYLINATRYYYIETEPTTAGNWWHYEDGVPTIWPKNPALEEPDEEPVDPKPEEPDVPVEPDVPAIPDNVTVRVTVDGKFFKDYSTTEFRDIFSEYNGTSYNNKEIVFTFNSNLKTTSQFWFEYPVGTTVKIDLNGNKLTLEAGAPLWMYATHYTLEIYSSVPGGELELYDGILARRNTKGKIVIGSREYKNNLTVTCPTANSEQQIVAVHRDTAEVTVEYLYCTIYPARYGLLRLNAINANTVVKLNAKIEGCTVYGKNIIDRETLVGTYSSNSSIVVTGTTFNAIDSSSISNFFVESELRDHYLGTLSFENCSFNGYYLNGNELSGGTIIVGAGCTFTNYGYTFSGNSFTSSNIILADGCTIVTNGNKVEIKGASAPSEPD